MTWDDEKNTFETQPRVPADEKLTAAEWNAHVTDQKDHSARHESGGIDEISVAGLAGELADPQDPKQEAVEDFVDTLLVGGDKITLTYDDSGDSLTIDTSALDTEGVFDAVDSLLVGGDNTTLVYDDANDTLTIDVDAPTEAEFNDHSTRHENGGADAIDVTGLSGVLADPQTPQAEAVEDIVDGLLTAGDKVTLAYDDGAGTLTVGTTALDAEEVRDEVGGLLSAGDKLSLTYDDAGNQLTIDTSALDAEEVRDEVGSLLAGGNGISVAVDDAGDTVTLSIPTDAVGTDELDEAITPTWTGEHTFSGGITGLPTPTADSDAARKSYVDAVKQGLDAKDSVVAATDGSNVDLTSSTDPNPIDGVTLADGDRVLLKDQTDATENGIYVASTAADPTTWSRAPDADADDEVTSGLFTFVEEGATAADSAYILATDGDIMLGTTALSFVQFSGGGELSAGDGLTKTGSTLDVSVADFAGLGLVDSGSNDLDVDGSAISHDALADISEGDHRTDEQVRDIAGAMAGAALSHDDPGDTIDVQREQIEDWVGSLVSGNGNITVTYDDAGDSLTVDTSGLNAEEVEDAVDSLLIGGTNVSLTYDDGANTLTIDATDTDTQLTTEEVQDIVGPFIGGGTDITVSYDDANDTLTIDSTAASDPHDNTAHTSNYTTTSPSDVDSTNWGDYEIQKNGTDGTGIINFKTN